jgi:hypothetical protein
VGDRFRAGLLQSHWSQGRPQTKKQRTRDALVMLLGGVAPYVAGLVASGAVGVGIQHIVDARSAPSRARAASPDFARLKLDGSWHAIWESSIDGRTVINHETVSVRQVRNRLYLQNDTRSPENPEGGYLWRGELEVWDNQHLLGWYVAREPNVISKGTFYFVLHPNGRDMGGRWVGRSYDGEMIDGCCAMARDEQRAHVVIDELLAVRNERDGIL